MEHDPETFDEDVRMLIARIGVNKGLPASILEAYKLGVIDERESAKKRKKK